MFHSSWLKNSSSEELQIYFDFVSGMNSVERMIDSMSYFMHKGDYQIGLLVGRTSFEEAFTQGDNGRRKRIKLVGSHFVENILETSRATLVEKLQGRYPNRGAYTTGVRFTISEGTDFREASIDKVRYAMAVKNGFSRMMYEHLFPEEPERYIGVSDRYLKERISEMETGMAALHMDVPRLEKAFSAWKKSARKIAIA